MSLTYGEMFAGYGGLGMGVQSVLGGSMSWCAELDAAPSKILAHHWPTVVNLGDVTKVDWASVPKVDVITGGYPCQPFSHAGQRQGTEDERHLWPYVADAVGILRPRLCVFENVRGHLSLGFDEVLRDLHLLDYDVRWYMLRAADVGAPHGRARIFIFAEDRHARILSGTDRRRGVHRDSGVGRFVSGPAQSVDDRQGSLRAPHDGTPAWRQAGTGDARAEREGTGVVHLAADGPGCICGDRRVASVASGEGCARGHRAGVSGDGGRLASPAERSGDVDERDARASGDVQGSNPACEPDGAGPRDAMATGRGADSDLPVRVVVGTGGEPVWAGGVHRSPSCMWPDGGGSCLRAADVGAPHGRFRVFVFASPGDPADVGHERGRGPRRGWDGPADPGQPVADAGASGLQGGGRPGEARGTDGVAGTAADGDRDAPADAGVQRHGRGQDGRGLGRVDGHDAGQARQRQRAWEVAGDRGAEAAADTAGAGRDWRPWGDAEPQRGGERQGRDDLGGRSAAWGQYAPAIERWERVMGRPAPAPTEPGPKGGQRLSPAFVEWLMGLPAGHVTDPAIGISRNDQLKALGNGVVWQQAAAATCMWLADVASEVAA